MDHQFNPRGVFTHVHAMTPLDYKSAGMAVMVPFVLQTLTSPHLSQCWQSINTIKNHPKSDEDGQTDRDIQAYRQMD